MKNHESVSTPVEVFELPVMSDYDPKNEKTIKDAMNFESIDGSKTSAEDANAINGEKVYPSPEDASPEALARIKAMQTRGKRLSRLANLLH